MTKLLAIIIISSFIAVFAAQAFAETKDELTQRQRAIIPIAAFTAKGDMEKLRSALEEGLTAGLSVNEIKEILIQMYAYCGFPRSLNAINAFGALLSERKKAGIKDEIGEEPKEIAAGTNRERLGHENRVKLTGSTAVGSYAQVVPTIDIFLKEHLFADIFERGVLSWQDREIATVSAIAGLGNAQAQLASHTRVSMHTGLTAVQMEDLANTLAAEVGESEGADAKAALEAVLASR